MGLEGNVAADQEAKCGSTLTQSTVPMYHTAAFTSHQNDITDGRHHSNPHSWVHRVFANSEHIHQRWQRDWTRDQCVTVAQLHTGHSPLLAAYLHRIGRRDSATCPHCNGAEETAEHLVFQCPAHDQTRGRHGLTSVYGSTMPVELSGAPPPDREWERDRQTDRQTERGKGTGNNGPGLPVLRLMAVGIDSITLPLLTKEYCTCTGTDVSAWSLCRCNCLHHRLCLYVALLGHLSGTFESRNK